MIVEQCIIQKYHPYSTHRGVLLHVPSLILSKTTRRDFLFVLYNHCPSPQTHHYKKRRFIQKCKKEKEKRKAYLKENTNKKNIIIGLFDSFTFPKWLSETWKNDPTATIRPITMVTAHVGVAASGRSSSSIDTITDWQ
ncbi:hypothetical protein Droror1_Dr00005194 [Drosera rotundifolia]